MDSIGETARLPEGRLTRTVADLKVGESAWVVPWAMSVDSQRCCALSHGFSIHGQPGGTVSMRISRRTDGFHVWIPDDYTWTVNEWTSGFKVIAVHEDDAR